MDSRIWKRILTMNNNNLGDNKCLITLTTGIQTFYSNKTFNLRDKLDTHK